MLGPVRNLDRCRLFAGDVFTFLRRRVPLAIDSPIASDSPIKETPRRQLIERFLIYQET